MFIGRKKELAQLERMYVQEGFRIFVVGGRSGAGKTTLLEEFCKDKDTIFFTASNENGRANLQRFSMDILAHYNNDITHEPFTFWESAFKYIRDTQVSLGKSQLVIVIEELDELATRDSVFMSTLKKCIDLDLINSRIFMIITSSDVKFLERTFLNQGSLLFNRTAGSIMLEKFTLSEDDVAKLKAQQSPGAKMIKYSADDVILCEGKPNSEMYKIIAGKAVCFLDYGTDDEHVLGTLKEGRTFGEYSMLTGRPGIYTVVAFSDMLLMRIDSDYFTKFIEMNAANSVEIMKNMADMINVLKVNIDLLRGENR